MGLQQLKLWVVHIPDSTRIISANFFVQCFAKKSRVAFWVPMTIFFVHWGPKGENPYLLKTPL